jgi:hypothetical protein
MYTLTSGSIVLHVAKHFVGARVRIEGSVASSR